MSFSIANRATIPSEAQQLARSKPQNITGLITFTSLQSYFITRNWKVFLVDEASFFILSEIDITSNPTRNSSVLSLNSNYLTYGLYKMSLTVKTQTSEMIFEEELTHFVKIIPTGLNIYAFENGIEEFSTGKLQSIKLDPAKYTIDPDLLADPKTLTYKFYCKLVSKSLGYVNYLLSEPNRMDLNSVQMQNISNGIDSCFQASSNF